MKITDFKNEDALDLIMNCIDPCVEIFGDKKITDAFRNHKDRNDLVKIAKLALKEHKKAVIEILAYTSGVKPKDYKANAFEIINQVLELLNDESILSFFSSQVLTSEAI